MKFKYDWRKHKNYAHAVLGLLILGFWIMMFEIIWKDKGAGWDAILISSVVTSAATEYAQALLKLGSNTWQGVLKTSAPAIVFSIYKIVIELL